MSDYWLVQLGYAVAFGLFMLFLVRRAEREADALLRRALDNLDRRAKLSAGPEVPDEGAGSEAAQAPEPVRAGRGERKSPAPTA